MKEKIEEILSEYNFTSEYVDDEDIKGFLRKDFATLIQEERKEAVEGFVNGYINQLRISPRKENVAPLLRFKKEYLSSIGKDE